MSCNLYKNTSRFLRTETDDIILNAKIFKGSRIFKTVLKRNTARETHDQMLKLTYSGKGGDTVHWDRCTVWKQVWSCVPTWLGTHLPSLPDGESKAFHGISLKIYFTGVSVLFVYVFVNCVHMPGVQRSGKGSRSPGTGIMRGCELPHGWWRPNPGPLWEQVLTPWTLSPAQQPFRIDILEGLVGGGRGLRGDGNS